MKLRTLIRAYRAIRTRVDAEWSRIVDEIVAAIDAAGGVVTDTPQKGLCRDWHIHEDHDGRRSFAGGVVRVGERLTMSNGPWRWKYSAEVAPYHPEVGDRLFQLEGKQRKLWERQERIALAIERRVPSATVASLGTRHRPAELHPRLANIVAHLVESGALDG